MTPFTPAYRYQNGSMRMRERLWSTSSVWYFEYACVASRGTNSRRRFEVRCGRTSTTISRDSAARIREHVHTNMTADALLPFSVLSIAHVEIIGPSCLSGIATDDICPAGKGSS